jgi:phage-related protein
MSATLAQPARRQPAETESATRTRVHVATPAPVLQAPESRADNDARPVPPTTRERLEAAFALPAEQVHADTEAEEADLDVAPDVEAEPAAAPPVEWTMRERIIEHARAAEASEAGTPETTAPAPVDVTVSKTVEPPAPLEQEAELEPDEAALLGGALDAAKQQVAVRATVATSETEAPAEPDASGSTSVTFTASLGPDVASNENAANTDAPARAVEAHARGPPQTVLSQPPIVQTKLAVSSPGDSLELEADAVALRVVRGHAAADASLRALPPVRGPPSIARSELPRSVTAVVAAPDGGTALDAAVRERIEPHLGVDLRHVRIRRGPDAAAAANDLHARAFTSGSTIFLAAESSPADVALIAHEATHVAQQQTVPGARTTLMRDVSDYLPDVSVSDIIPDWILDGVRSAVRAIPGYTLLTYITGTDPLTDEPVRVDQQELIDTLLTYGPFGPAVGPVLQAIDLLGDIFNFVSENLDAHDLTLARISRDIDNAWDELSVTNGIAGNVAIVERYVNAFLRDVRAFVDSIVEQVLEMVRAVVAEVAEPLLETPEIAPIWNLTKKVLHYDPLRGTDVEAPTAEIIADFLRLIGQEQRLAQMEERGTLQETADWLDTQLATFTSLITELGTLFADAWAAIQPQNLPDLMTNLESLAQRAFGFVQRVGEFAATVILKILEIIKDALLGWLSENAHRVPGFHLLTVILGQNPFTGEAVPRTAENLIKGFITLLPNGEETYNQLAESGVIGEAAGRIEGEMARLGISLEMITGLFHGIWDTLSLDDLLDPIGAFQRILDLFGEPLSRLIEFIGVVIEVVITLVLRLMNFPSDLLSSIISNALQAIEDIKRDPVGFIKNMLQAVKLGFTGFFDNILTYLLQGLAAWLFRGLGQLGITIPSDLSFMSILTLVLQVLGISAEALWTKLGEHIGAERVAMIRGAIDRLSGIWDFIKDVQENGISAVWRFIESQLSNLWDTLLNMAKDWIMQTIIQRVTARLLSMLDPTGIMAVVNSFIAFFNAVQSAIEYLREILEIVNRYVMTLAQIAAGNIVPGAQMLEQGLAAAVPVAIGFLANQVGLGNVPEKIVEIIGQLRELVDQALDWLIEQALRLGQAVLNALGLGEQQQPAEGTGDPEHDAAVTAGFAAIEVKEQELAVDGQLSQEAAMQVATAVKTDHPIFTKLEPVAAAGHWSFEWAASDGGTHPTSGVVAAADPGVSAPGLGTTGTHGAHPPSNRNGPNIHWTESEHIIPFATGKRLWQMVNLVVPGRGRHEDDGQTTIMIYYEAARFKTPADNIRSTQFETALTGANVQRRLTDARRAYATNPSHDMSDATDVFAQLVQGLRAAKDDAIERTNTAITQENQLKMDGNARTNGERRGPPGNPEAALPSAADVTSAATTQYDNIVDLVEHEVAAVNILT